MDDKPKYESKKQYWYLVITIYTCLTVMGIVENARSVSFLIMKEYFNVSYEAYGLLNSCLSISYIGFCFLSSCIVPYVGYKCLFLVGYVIMAIGCFVTRFAHSFVTAGCCMFVVWMGFGFFEIGSNASSTVVFIENQGTMMSLMHFFFGIGAVIGPNVAKWSMSVLSNGFYSIYLVLGFIVTFFLIITMFIPFKLPWISVDTSNTAKPSLTVYSALKTPSIWLCSLTMGIMQAVESSGPSWAPLYLTDVLGLSVNTVTSFSTWLYIIFTLSRLLAGPLIDRCGYYCSLYISLIACFLLLFIGFFMGKNGIYLFALTGFFYSANWPIFICVMMGYYKYDAPTATSVVIVLQGVLLLPMSTILGAMNENLGKEWAYRFTLVFCFIGCILLTCVYFSQQRKEKRELKSKDSEMVSITGEKKHEEVPSGVDSDIVQPVKSENSVVVIEKQA